MKLTDKVTVRPEVMSRQVGDEIVLLDTASGEYFGLNAVGARIWQLMSGGMTFSEICTVLVAEYETGPGELQKDLLSLAEQLSARQLVSLAGHVDSPRHTENGKSA